MNAPVVIPTLDPTDAAFGSATEAVNAWRGRCLGWFARAETAVTRALVAFAAADPDTPLPHLTGQRLAALATVLGQRGEAKALAALANYRNHEALRSFVAHGQSKITIDRLQRWHATITVHLLRGREYTRPFLVVDEEEAVDIVRSLGRDCQRLEAQLAGFHTDAGAYPKALRTGTSMPWTATVRGNDTALDSLPASL